MLNTAKLIGIGVKKLMTNGSVSTDTQRWAASPARVLCTSHLQC